MREIVRVGTAIFGAFSSIQRDQSCMTQPSVKESLPWPLGRVRREDPAILQRSNLTPARHRAAGGFVRGGGAWRIQKLHDTGVIAHDVSVLSAERIGRPITLIVEVSVESEKIEALNEVKRPSRRPLKCSSVLRDGRSGFHSGRDRDGHGEIRAYDRAAVLQAEDVKRFRTYVAMARVKATLNVPV